MIAKKLGNVTIIFPDKNMMKKILQDAGLSEKDLEEIEEKK